MIRVEAAWRTFDLAVEQVHAVADVTLAAETGEFVFIRGHSGSGKSTLLNLMAAIDLPTQGRVFVDGHDTRELGESDRVKLRRRQVGMVHQMDYLVEELTAAENVSLVQEASGQGPRESAREAAEMLELVGLQGLGERFPRQLSGGQRQRVGIARAMAGNRPVIIADEPTGSLDSQNSLDVFQLFGKLASLGKTVIVASHDERCAEVASRPFVMVDGALTASRS